MGLLDKKKRKQLEIKDQYFIFAGRWFEKTEDEKYVGCRAVDDSSEIPEEYLRAWQDWKPKPIDRERYGLPNYSGRSGKLY
jgi:hypothetical protein